MEKKNEKVIIEAEIASQLAEHYSETNKRIIEIESDVFETGKVSKELFKKLQVYLEYNFELVSLQRSQINTLLQVLKLSDSHVIDALGMKGDK